MRHIAPRLFCLALPVLAILVLTACGGSPTATPIALPVAFPVALAVALASAHLRPW